LDWAEFDRQPIEILQAILSHQSLKLRDEDSLFESISSAVGRDARFAVLLASARFEHFSPDSMESFVGLISDSFYFLTGAVWAALAKRIVLIVSPAEWSDRYWQYWVECRYTGTDLLNGIIAHLSWKHGASVISISQVEKVKMVRLFQIGKNSSGTHYLFLSALEVFGEILDPFS
jgi:hypothetical protein